MEIVKSLQSQKVLKSILVVLVGSILLTISAKIKIPFYPVPMTMQTFVVLLMGVAFGWRIGVATISLYLFEGIIALPVFAGTPEKGIGLVYFTGPTMGYLIGFLLAAFLSGYLKPINNLFTKILSAIIFSYPLFIFFGLLIFGVFGFKLEHNLLGISLYFLCLFAAIILSFKSNAFGHALILLISVLPIYVLGIFWLGLVIGWDKPLFELGAEPFLLAELFKIYLLAALCPVLKKLNKFT